MGSIMGSYYLARIDKLGSIRLLQDYVWNVVNGTTYLWISSHLCTLIPINGKRPIYLPHVECREIVDSSPTNLQDTRSKSSDDR
eukprot:scaffold235499_cov20-Cyclotella_meneghiniana.AAC.1